MGGGSVSTWGPGMVPRFSLPCLAVPLGKQDPSCSPLAGRRAPAWAEVPRGPDQSDQEPRADALLLPLARAVHEAVGGGGVSLQPRKRPSSGCRPLALTHLLLSQAWGLPGEEPLPRLMSTNPLPSSCPSPGPQHRAAGGPHPSHKVLTLVPGGSLHLASPQCSHTTGRKGRSSYFPILQRGS